MVRSLKGVNYGENNKTEEEGLEGTKDIQVQNAHLKIDYEQNEEEIYILS